MSYIEWNDAYKLGHGQIDGEHYTLHVHLNRVVEAVFGEKDQLALAGHAGRDTLVESEVEALKRATSDHFRSEETLMAASDFPAMKHHAEQHAELIRELERFSEHFHSTRSDSLPHAVRFLREWFEFHIDTYDRALVRWLNTGESPSTRSSED